MAVSRSGALRTPDLATRCCLRSGPISNIASGRWRAVRPRPRLPAGFAATPTSNSERALVELEIRERTVREHIVQKHVRAPVRFECAPPMPALVPEIHHRIPRLESYLIHRLTVLTPERPAVPARCSQR